MQDMIGRHVEVITGDIVYIGILIEVNETEIHLQAEERWITVPVEKVVDVRVK